MINYKSQGLIKQGILFSLVCFLLHFFVRNHHLLIVFRWLLILNKVNHGFDIEIADVVYRGICSECRVSEAAAGTPAGAAPGST